MLAMQTEQTQQRNKSYNNTLECVFLLLQHQLFLEA